MPRELAVSSSTAASGHSPQMVSEIHVDTPGDSQRFYGYLAGKRARPKADEGKPSGAAVVAPALSPIKKDCGAVHLPMQTQCSGGDWRHSRFGQCVAHVQILTNAITNLPSLCTQYGQEQKRCDVCQWQNARGNLRRQERKAQASWHVPAARKPSPQR